MKSAARTLVPAICLAISVLALSAPIPRRTTKANVFKHVVVIVQENRTPDNLFQGLCAPPFGNSTSCSTTPNSTQYNISTANWLDKNVSGGIIQPVSMPFGVGYDMNHTHASFVSMCDAAQTGGPCQMDGAGNILCAGVCPPNPAFEYVDYTTGDLNPYLQLATQYGFANYMFQTNQGPTYTSHQYLFGGTSAPSASDDANGIFVAENFTAPQGANYNPGADTGCLAPLGEWNWLITPQTAPLESRLTNSQLGTFCFNHSTMATLVDNAGLTWKYYSMPVNNANGLNPGGSIVTAPNSIQAICQPDSEFEHCTGTEWANNVDLNPSDVLTDISNCNLRSLNWVIPIGQNSDHAGSPNTTGGPSWVASIVNAIGNDTTCEGGNGYFSDTAILITWDDWGGWYDHVAPEILSGVEGDYQFGFRVPLIVVSAYTSQGFIANDRYDFGSILRFIESALALPGGEGALGFADARAKDDLGIFFNLTKPRKFTTIDAPLKADFFLHDTRVPEPPDTD